MPGREMSTVSIDLAFLVTAATFLSGETERAGETPIPRLTGTSEAADCTSAWGKVKGPDPESVEIVRTSPFQLLTGDEALSMRSLPVTPPSPSPPLRRDC